MGTPPCESGFMKVTVAKRWETAESRTEYGLDGTSEMIDNTFQTYNYFNFNAQFWLQELISAWVGKKNVRNGLFFPIMLRFVWNLSILLYSLNISSINCNKVHILTPFVWKLASSLCLCSQLYIFLLVHKELNPLGSNKHYGFCVDLNVTLLCLVRWMYKRIICNLTTNGLIENCLLRWTLHNDEHNSPFSCFPVENYLHIFVC